MNVLVPIANGSEEMEAVIIVDMLRRAGVGVTLAGDADIVTCSRGVRIIPDVVLEDLEDDTNFDAIILPGGAQGVSNLAANGQLESMVRRHRAAGRLTAAICAAPTILHDWQLLPSSATVTGHPSVQHVLDAYTFSFDRVVEDGQVITSRGAGTAFEFSLALIRRLMDTTIARRIAGDIVLYE
ncbi:MAG: DJ-1/PfpI family protein [Candidatus Kapabacteria bacterium]|jgi:DJ-1 family protein|nr:DJ-1/PfpI family protein [Candidatus Kapabacteria bacterium]